MHLKAHNSRIWLTIRRFGAWNGSQGLGFGHGRLGKAHYARLGGPAKVPTFKVPKIDPPPKKNLKPHFTRHGFHKNRFREETRTPQGKLFRVVDGKISEQWALR
jgi:hypothetical protein